MPAPLTISIELTLPEAQIILNAMDTAVKSDGLALALQVAPIAAKIKQVGDAAVAAVAKASADAKAAANGADKPEGETLN